MARGKKYELVNKTYELLQHTSPQDITIRMIAEAADCTSTVIYRHYENLDHLILIASIRFLEDYTKNLGNIMSTETDSLELLIKMWREFAVQSFKQVDVFEMLFWGKYRNRLGEAIMEYYQLFPENWQNLNGVFTSVFFNNKLEERNYIIVQQAASAGYFPQENIRLFSDLQCYLFHGFLIEYRATYREPGKAEEGVERFMKMLDYLIASNRRR